MREQLPTPEPGMVVRFDYQWADRKQPRKDRPACVVLVKVRPDPRPHREGDEPARLDEVIYLPVSTKPPRADQAAVRIPDQVRRHLGLPGESWIVISECNVQFWPNDLSRVPGSGRWLYGFLPPRFFRSVRDRLVEELKSQRLKMGNVRYLPPRTRS
ncbi:MULTISPECIES: hypothetical protein [Bradyrhizobium]|uniref:hypothetical protein n=1 Tax=Bradyrhizobium TaxID=374 RepID=UPI00155EA7B6|nr:MULTISPECIES: hypothetical protein [Bradyrhizobium]UUO25853.1 hypothetical protein DCG74_00310 [Bradyrhizobium sp. WBAH42]UWU70533.1 hypothetical protein N2602_08390 [Bradyrhizobium sp. NC92]